jgi:hypothetical protein
VTGEDARSTSVRLSVGPDHGVIMLTAVKLVDQWRAVERRLPSDWEAVSLRLRTEQPEELSVAARILAPMNVGHAGDTLALTVRRAGGAAGPEAARRLFGRLDEARIWCLLEQEGVTESRPVLEEPVGRRTSVAEVWDAALAELPADWSDLLCALDIDSSALLPRAALHCAPLNPTRDRDRIGFVFRSARRAGYGASPAMARRCFERLDGEGITGQVTVLRFLSDTDDVGTQGPVFVIGGRAL